MNAEFTNQRLRGEGSAFPGRLLRFRLRRNNFEGLVLPRHAYLFSAAGATSLKAWGNAPGKLGVSERALKARFTGGVASILHITFVILDVLFVQKLAVFFLKGAAAMVFLLGLHVSADFAKRLGHGGTIAEEGFWMNRAFSAGLCACVVHGALPQASMKAAPLALNQHAVPDKQFADRAASLLDRLFLSPAGDSFETSKQPAGFAMQTEFSDERFCESGSAFPGRLLRFRLRRNNIEGLVLPRHTVPDKRFAEGAASLLDRFFLIPAGESFKTSKPLC
jgi:hypothetical protein